MGSPPPSPHHHHLLQSEKGLKQVRGGGRDSTRVRKRWHNGSEREKVRDRQTVCQWQMEKRWKESERQKLRDGSGFHVWWELRKSYERFRVHLFGFSVLLEEQRWKQFAWLNSKLGLTGHIQTPTSSQGKENREWDELEVAIWKESGGRESWGWKEWQQNAWEL